MIDNVLYPAMIIQLQLARLLTLVDRRFDVLVLVVCLANHFNRLWIYVHVFPVKSNFDLQSLGTPSW